AKDNLSNPCSCPPRAIISARGMATTRRTEEGRDQEVTGRANDHHAISVQLAKVTSGQSQLLQVPEVPCHMRARTGQAPSWATTATSNPVEGLWSNLTGKGGELADLTCPSLAGEIAGPTAASAGCGGRRILRIRSCGMPACRSPEHHPPPSLAWWV